jgi:tagaturonate epimerase
MVLGKYSLGIGDRFASQGAAQLHALQLAKTQGIQITPVWNKSNREHMIVHSVPEETRQAADDAVNKMHWVDPYFVDADHINLSNVDRFIPSCDFFTLDVAEFIGKTADDAAISAFIADNKSLIGELKIPGIDKHFHIDESGLRKFAQTFLFAIRQAGMIYRHIENKKGKGSFITEVSMDEVNDAQTPIDLFFILKELAAEHIPVDTIAPKFTGRFNKGVDYAGDLCHFEEEFEQDLLVLDYVKKMYSLPSTLKLSVHSGSDKFSLYPIIAKLIHKLDQGIHIKTAGTTWLEEVIGLAMAGAESLDLVKNIYIKGLKRFDELTGPYASVIDIDRNELPAPEEVQLWSGEKMANTLRHIPGHPDYNPNFRQLIHVSYKIAAEYANVYIHYLAANEELVGKQVTENLYERHIKRLFQI